jgi:methyltransferase (TIGR00027 family)
MDRSSRTAQYMALFRAVESARPSRRRLFSDPFAREFLGPPLRFAAAVSRLPLLGSVIPAIMDAAWPGARTSGVARTRFIDDRLERALREGFRQIVILGAGFDSRAYRMTGLSGARVIEVDHPATSGQKQRVLARTLGRLPQNVRFLEIDFNTQSLDEGLRTVSADLAAPTVVIWEGVTNYLTAEGVAATFESLRRAMKTCSVIFTYIDKDVLDPNAAFEGASRAKARITRVGENWTFGFTPSELPAYLGLHGFRLVEDIGSREFRSLYMPPRRRLLRGYDWYRIAVAERHLT